jgi:hypothetical protein
VMDGYKHEIIELVGKMTPTRPSRSQIKKGVGKKHNTIDIIVCKAKEVASCLKRDHREEGHATHNLAERRER